MKEVVFDATAVAIAKTISAQLLVSIVGDEDIQRDVTIATEH